MSIAHLPSAGPEPSPEELELTRGLVRGVVLAQGNIFIKELLRDKKIKIGATKTDFERNLLQAIDGGHLRYAEVRDWLEEVEGWGDQHVYFYEVPQAVSRQLIWNDEKRVRERVVKAGLGDLWNADTSLAFPEEPALTGIYFEPGSRTLRLAWHEGAYGWVRVADLDRQEEIEGDQYEFRAYRQRASRTVMRFEVRLNAGVAALFLSSHLTGKEHENALQDAQAKTQSLFGLKEVWANPMIVAKVIANLDQELTDGSASMEAAPETVQLESGGSYIRFGSHVPHRSYLEAAAVKGVRLAIKKPALRQFTGNVGTFEFRKDGGPGISRDIRVQLYGQEKRIRLWQRMTATDVWRILEILRRYQRP
ncbi:MAG TPA: hypothetical protein VF789_11810 [Thermoanaerobaculia bacterium]